MLLAAVENQPRDQVEAARIDGANGLQIFRDIKAMDIVEGTGQVQRMVIARDLVQLPR